MRFKIIGKITDVQIIAGGKQIRELDYLSKSL